MRIQSKYIVVIILLALSAGLAYDSLSNYVNPYISVADVVSKSSQYRGTSLQVMGEVEANSLQRSDDGSIGFTLTDGSASIGVSYRGVPPQNLEQGNDIVVVGSLTEAGLIEASQIMVKCPSKYEGEDQQETSHVFLAAIAVAALGVGYLVFTVVWKKS
ncbi:MAG: cytochrome c maturation protein CcmE [Nanoarchaeota archaeon]|nr:cytochrome c maturation protein CcmE [Nanoarchaeota archaeon]